jgi:hypothetical protein
MFTSVDIYANRNIMTSVVRISAQFTVSMLLLMSLCVHETLVLCYVLPPCMNEVHFEPFRFLFTKKSLLGRKWLFYPWTMELLGILSWLSV